MNELWDMIWVELTKAIRSRIPLWTSLGSFFMPLGIGFLIFVSKNPQISQKLGLVGAKANLMGYAGTDWPTYLRLCSQMMAVAGFFLFVIVISWVFGREFSDGTVKDLLAVPIHRFTILLAKFVVAILWSAALMILILVLTMTVGAIISLPGGSLNILWRGTCTAAVTGLLVITVVMPFALFASIGRGYLLPMGLAILTLMSTNLVAVLGWGEYFPWAVPGLFAQGDSPLEPASYWIALVTGIVGIYVTYLWWAHADQNR
jgi:ABC-2 type transport system permease protein